MKHKLMLSSLLLMASFLALGQTALVSSTWYVDGVHGSDTNDCRSLQTACKTIGHAISLASSGDSIVVAAATYTENLTIGFSLKVIGSGASTTIIDGRGVNTVVTIPNSGTFVTLSKLTIRNGLVNGQAAAGGGINNAGTLTISNSTVSGNQASTNCGRPFSGSFGGGIYNRGTLTITNSTVSGNTAFATNCDGFFFCHSFGGGIFNGGGTLTVNTSTISGNFVRARGAAFGGGIYGTATISNSTVSGNSAGSGGGIDYPSTLQNSIVSNNSGGNCKGTMTSNGYNLSSDNTCNFHGSGDRNNTDPKLGPLQNNGGPTQTQALLPGSPAIDAGNPSGCTDGHGHLLKTDQRGYPRPDHEDSGGCDMGAYERQTD
jgi:hypothetical protein